LSIFETSEKIYDFVFLLSGPEPQKSDLKKVLLRKAEQYPNYQFALISQDCKTDDTQNLKVFNSPDSAALSRIISENNTVVCRSGYSTLMDLHVLGVTNTILVPTPGQSEQEYLAEYWSMKFASVVVKQKDLTDLKF
jgi:UDP-N-acetylglucosamine:LPS N-acetylglucosamine transferase